MIFTYYQYTNPNDPEEQLYNIHLNSIICTGSDGSPRPNQKVYVVNTVNNQKVMKLAFSNFLIENGAVSRYNSCHYDDTAGITSIKDPRYTPGISPKTMDGYPDYSWYRQTYMTTLKLAVKHDNTRENLNFLDTEADSVGHRSFSLFAVDSSHKPTLGEWPSPIVVRTGSGSVVKFYDLNDTQFQNPLYWKNCGIKVTFVYNLIPDKTYNYVVYNQSGLPIKNIYGSNANYGTITVEGQVRLVRFDNIRNARDIGGWPTLDKLKRMKYGVIFRGSLLTYMSGYNYGYGVLTPAVESLPDRREFYKLNIQKEIDNLTYQSTSATVSPMIRIDENNNPESLGIEYYTQSGTKSYQSVATSGYTLFINYLNAMLQGIKNGKNIYVHCLQGKDRTGTQMAVLEALCGISLDSIVKDYELSSLWCSNTYTRFEFQTGNISETSTTKIDTTTSTWGKFGVTSNSITIPQAVLNWFRNHYSTAKVKGDNGLDIPNADDALKYILSKLLENPSLQKKRIAVIGDSQSAFKLSRHGGNIANMWWYKAAKSLNIDPVENLNNNSFGESMVTESNSKSKRACSTERLQQIKVNGENPDFTFIMMGGNDWGAGATIGNWNTGDPLPADYNAAGKEATLNFKPAYALMLHRINNLYPDNLSICITQPLLSMKTTGGRAIKDYMEAMVDIAKKFNIPVIDLYKLCGETIWKEAQNPSDPQEPYASSKYINDSWVHLNPLGQLYIADKINAELLKVLYPHMAIIGDSISAYKENNSNGRYGYEYPSSRGNNQVKSPTLMWWYKVAQYLGYDNRVINDSASGTSICVKDGGLQEKDLEEIRGVSDIRINDLYVYPENLETIIVFMGMNDFRFGVPIGSWNVGDPYPDESASTIDFKPGYALLLHKLKTRYPNAKIYCCNGFNWNGAGTINGNKMIAFKEAIEDIATKCECPILNTYACTTEIYNHPTQYTVEGVHPNINGLLLLADAIIDSLQSLNN